MMFKKKYKELDYRIRQLEEELQFRLYDEFQEWLNELKKKYNVEFDIIDPYTTMRLLVNKVGNKDLIYVPIKNYDVFIGNRDNLEDYKEEVTKKLNSYLVETKIDKKTKK